METYTGNIVKILNADCMKVMGEYPDNHFDLSVVDPPYGININMNMGRKKGCKPAHEKKDWDKSTPSAEYFSELRRVSRDVIVWGGNYFTEFLEPTKAWIFWDKLLPKGVSFADGELAWTTFDKTLVKLEVLYTGFQGMDPGGKIHPTQKPIRLYDRIFERYATHDFRILDTHLGSGSSAIAAHYAGVKEFIGVEIDKDYFNRAVSRVHESTLQKTFF